MFFDLSNAVYSGSGTYFYDIPVFIRSNGPISNFDFWFKFNQTEMTYNSTINMIPALDPFTYFNPLNDVLSNTTSGPSATYLVPMNTTLLFVRFQLSGPCTLIDSTDFNSITTLLNGSVCKNKFINLGSGSSFIGISPSILCDGNTANFTGPISVNDKPVASWNWDFGNGTSAITQNGSATYSTGVYSVSLNATTNDGCVYSISQVLDVAAVPLASFTFVVTANQDSVIFTNGTGPASYLWDFGDGSQSTESDPIHTYIGGGIFIVSLSATNQGCSTTFIDTILIDRPTALFTYNGNCSASVVSFSNLSTYVNGTIISNQWNFGDGNVSSQQNPSNIYGIAGVYTVTLTVTGSNGYQSVYTENITIANKPIVLFTASAVSGCSPHSTNFTDFSLTEPGSIYYWTFGDNTFSTLQNPSKTYIDAGLYTVKLIVSSVNGCIDSLIKQNYINVLETPTADFDNSPGCANTFVDFNEIIQPGAPNSLWNWNFGDGGTSNVQNPTHFYPSEGNFNVTLNVTNSVGCSDELTLPIFIRNQPNALFTILDTTGCAPLNAVFSNNSTTAVGSTFTWNFGNGVTSNVQNPSEVYDNSGLFTVTLIVTAPGGCADTLTRTDLIDVYSGLVVDFEYDNNCSGDLTQFTDLSVASSGSLNSWNWNFGNGITASLPDPQIYYDLPGTYTVELVVGTDQGCSDTIILPITMDEKPLVSFTVPSEYGCAPYDVLFTNTTTQDAGASYFWSFGDGTTSNLESPTHTYDSTTTFSVILVVTSPNGCSDSLVQSNFIQLQDPPTAGFTIVNDTLFIPESQSFVNNLSINASTYFWTFDDGFSSSLFEPAHIFADAGTFNMCLSAISEFGCESIYCDTIIVFQSAEIAIPSAFTPNGDGANDFFLVRGGPLRSFEMKIFNEWGNLVFSSTDQLVGWDGTHSDIPQSSGAFEYVITGETLYGEELNEYGVINLKR
jgi:gliding motility-associated-like protein